jgi:hypothetical protein
MRFVSLTSWDEKFRLSFTTRFCFCFSRPQSYRVVATLLFLETPLPCPSSHTKHFDVCPCKHTSWGIPTHRTCPLCSLVTIHQRFGRKYWLHLQGRSEGRAREKLLALRYDPEHGGSSSTNIRTYQTIRCYTTEDDVIHSHWSENLTYNC